MDCIKVNFGELTTCFPAFATVLTQSMSNNSLRQIYERSQLLISPTVRGDMPFITRSLDQIQQEIKNMSEKIRPTQELHAKA
jgi:hypothetical protein